MSCTARVSSPCAEWSLNPSRMWAICILRGDARPRVWWCQFNVCALWKVIRGTVGTCRGVLYIINSRKFTEGWQSFRITFSMLNSFLLSPLSLCCSVIIGWVSNGSSWFQIIPNQEHEVFIHQLLHLLLVQLSTIIPLFSSCEEWHVPGRRKTQMLRYKSLCRIFIKANFIKINFT